MVMVTMCMYLSTCIAGNDWKAISINTSNEEQITMIRFHDNVSVGRGGEAFENLRWKRYYHLVYAWSNTFYQQMQLSNIHFISFLKTSLAIRQNEISTHFQYQEIVLVYVSPCLGEGPSWQVPLVPRSLGQEPRRRSSPLWVRPTGW